MARFASLVLCLFLALAWPAAAQTRQARLALVIGEANYKIAPLATPVNDAGLVAETLREAGFAVTEGANLNGADLRKALHDFAGKAELAGPDAVIFVYLSGRGLQFSGQNYFVPVDAFVQREADVPLVTIRLADYFDKIAAAPARARFFVLDGARILHFATEGMPFASGFGLVKAPANTVYAFNEAPGAVAPDEPGPYGAYAQALVEMLRQGFTLPQVFTEARLRANQISDGNIVPWNTGTLAAPFALFARAANAPPLRLIAETAAVHTFPVPQAYLLAIARDRLESYADFCTAFPHAPLVLRVQALLAARREALTWHDALDADTPEAFWTYLRRYPRGPHFADARRRLTILAAPLAPPPRFNPYAFKDLPPPSDAETETLERPVLTFADPAFPPPPPPGDLLPERPVPFEHLPPPKPGGPGLLPMPATLFLPFSKPLLEAASTRPVHEAPSASLPAPATVAPAIPPKVKPAPPPSAKKEEASPAIAAGGAPLPPKRPSSLDAASESLNKNLDKRLKRHAHLAAPPAADAESHAHEKEAKSKKKPHTKKHRR